MLDPKKQAEFEQGAAAMAETFPPMLYGLYRGFIKEGFTEQRAYSLTESYFVALAVRPSSPEAD